MKEIAVWEYKCNKFEIVSIGSVLFVTPTRNTRVKVLRILEVDLDYPDYVMITFEGYVV